MRVEISGLENIPKTGGCILVTNHLSRLDAPLLYMLLSRNDARGWVADKYKSNLFIATVVKIVDGIWINREEADFHALKEARNHLVAGGLFGVAPEGTRSQTGALIPAKTGFAYLADKAQVPVVPIAVHGTEVAMQQIMRLHRPTVYAMIGKPFILPPVERSRREEALQQNTDEIMCRIALMLPEAYRGVYADHPRLYELLALQNGSLS